MLRSARRSLNAFARLLNVVMLTPCEWVSFFHLALAASKWTAEESFYVQEKKERAPYKEAY